MRRVLFRRYDRKHDNDRASSSLFLRRGRHRFSGAEHPFDSESGRIDAHVLCLLGDVKPVGRGIHHAIGLDFEDLIDPSLRVEGSSRDEFAAQLFRGIMGLPEGDIDIIAEGKKDSMMGPESGHVEDVAPGLDPPLPAFIGLWNVNGFSGCAAGLPEGGHFPDIASQQSLRKEKGPSPGIFSSPLFR